MNADEHPVPLDSPTPSAPSAGRTALAFVLSALVLVGMALAVRSDRLAGRPAESAIAHCFTADSYAKLALSAEAARAHGGRALWARAEAEYRAALKSQPRNMRARRGLAAILWMRNEPSAAAHIVKAPVDVPAGRKDVWLATQTAYGAILIPDEESTLGRYRTALAAQDLGWSRYPALQALALYSGDTKAAAEWGRRMRSDGVPDRRVQAALGIAGLLIFLAGIGLLRGFLMHPWTDRLPPLPIRTRSLVWYSIIGLTLQTLPAQFVPGLESARGGGSYGWLLATYLAGAGLAALFVWASLFNKGVSFSALGWRWKGTLRWAGGGYAALLPVLAVAAGVSTSLSARFFPHVETPINPAAQMVGVAQGWQLAAVILTVCVVGPFTEELLFRGLLFRGLSHSFGPWGGAVLSSAVFAALHPQLPLGFLPIMCIGVGLCVVYRGSGTLTASWLCHAINNAVTVLFTLSAYGYVGWT